MNTILVPTYTVKLKKQNTLRQHQYHLCVCVSIPDLHTCVSASKLCMYLQFLSHIAVVLNHNMVIINKHTHQVTYSKAFKTFQISYSKAFKTFQISCCPESYNVGTQTYIENKVRISHVELAIFFC